tara:strand:+ start:10894 stop:12765 length:1872 start_codon:yes stop_codon:yes gene_type:complete
MAVQTTEEFKNGGATSYSITIEYLQASDIKVRIDGALQTYVASSPSSGEYTVSGTTVTLGAQAASGTGNVHIYRDTDVDTAAAVFAAGSSIRAADLNAIHDMARMGVAEARSTIITDDIKNDAVTTAKIKDANVTTAKIADSNVTTAKIANGAVTADKFASDSVTSDKIADDSINSEHYVDGSIDTAHIADAQITTAKIADDAINDAKIADGTLDGRYYTETELNAGQLDNRYYTETEAEALFLRQDSSETIASGVTWSSNDSKVATTAAIDLRIIDLIDDVGGFVPIANETSFPTANPDVNNGAGTIVSVKAASTTLTPSGTTVTIANGAGSGNTVTITGVSSAIASGFGFLVETTTTLHTYTFHRLTPKATEVSTVAANAVNIANAGANVVNIDSFADRYQISTSAPTTRSDGSTLAAGDLWFDSSSNKVMMVYDASSGDGFSPITPNQSDLTNINIVAGQITFTEDLGLITNAVNTGSGNNSVNTVGTNITNVNTVAGVSANVTTVAGSISNVNTVAGSISNVNTVGASIADVNRYAAEYVIQSGTPSSPSAGDLWYNSTANTLNYYTGGAWVAIAPGISGLINDANPALANHLDCNDKNLTEVGTVSGNNLQIDFGTIA